MFEINQQATLAKVDHKTGTSEESILRVILKIIVSGVAAKKVAALFGVENPVEIENAFFEYPKDADGKPDEKLAPEIRLPNIQAVSLDADIKSLAAYEIEVADLPALTVEKITKFKVKPTSNLRFDVQFNVTIEQPPPNYLETAVGHEGKVVKVRLKSLQPTLALPRGKRKPEPAQQELKAAA